MSKKCLIPLGLVLSLTPNVANLTSCTKVEYSNVELKTTMEEVASYPLQRWNFNLTTKDDGTTQVGNIVEREGFNEVIYNDLNNEAVRYRMDDTDVELKVWDTAIIKYNVERVVVYNNEKTYSTYSGELQMSSYGGAGLMTYWRKYDNGRSYRETIFSTYQEITSTYPSDRYSIGSKIYYNVTYTISLPQLSEEKSEESIGNKQAQNDLTMTIPQNTFVNVANKYNSDNIAYTNAKKIYDNYNKGKRTIEAKVVLNDLYNESEEKVIDKSKGEILSIGDIVKFTNNKSNKYDNFINRYFKITSVEFNFNGVPSIYLKGKEVLEDE